MKITVSNKLKRIHGTYLIEMFRHAGCSIKTAPLLITASNTFPIMIDNFNILVDYGDNAKPRYELGKQLKFHCTVKHKDIFPFPPISFVDWNQYRELRSFINYSAKDDIILSCQVPRRGALKRRTLVQNLLKQQYSNKVDTTIVNQIDFWRKINTCLVSVCVPGWCNNMLDRGQIQQMAFGCCTISPALPEIFPFNEHLIANTHYLQCKNDYSDLIDIIEWCKTNRNACIEIGHNAKRFFEHTCLPLQVMQWIRKCIK